MISLLLALALTVKPLVRFHACLQSTKVEPYADLAAFGFWSNGHRYMRCNIWRANDTIVCL